MAIWFITINVFEVLLIKLSAQADGNSSVMWNKAAKCSAEEHAGFTQIFVANCMPHFLQQDPEAARENHEYGGLSLEVQDHFSELVLKFCPFSACFSVKTKKAPANIRPLHTSGFGIFNKNKQGRHYLPQAHGNEVNSCLLHHALVLCTQ